MSRPRVTFSRNGMTSSGPSGLPNDTSKRASYGLMSGAMAPIVETAARRAARCERCPGRALLSGSMLTAYRRILAVPGALLFSATGLVARLPLSMETLGIVLLVVAETGSYGLAGSLAAATTIANAVASILQGRYLDQIGQPRVLPPLIVLWGTAVAGLVVSLYADWPRWVSFAAAVVMGLTLPPIGTCVRARWSHVIAGE